MAEFPIASAILYSVAFNPDSLQQSLPRSRAIRYSERCFLGTLAAILVIRVDYCAANRHFCSTRYPQPFPFTDAGIIVSTGKRRRQMRRHWDPVS
jgi:hypothetical protein